MLGEGYGTVTLPQVGERTISGEVGRAVDCKNLRIVAVAREPVRNLPGFFLGGSQSRIHSVTV